MKHSVTKNLFNLNKEKSLFGRYINQDDIHPLLKDQKKNLAIEEIGKSIKHENIYAIKIGTGKRKILMWSQMHGNEATTTKAIFDLINTLENAADNNIDYILANCQLIIVPILNPDGAKAYTRTNANSVDLNRDALDQSQPESVALRSLFNNCKPDFCFNLHGQRTIYSVGNKPNSSVISFLSPTQDTQKTVTANRKLAMELIVAMRESLEQLIPSSVAVYDDSFNLNCVGDYFQAQGVATVLFEAGHFSRDYKREQTRYYIYHSLLVALDVIAREAESNFDHNLYNDIPENQKLFYDVIIRNVNFFSDGKVGNHDIAILYQEELKENGIEFIPIIEKIGDLSKFFGHKEHVFNNDKLSTANNVELKVGNAIDFVMVKNERLSLKLD